MKKKRPANKKPFIVFTPYLVIGSVLKVFYLLGQWRDHY